MAPGQIGYNSRKVSYRGPRHELLDLNIKVTVSDPENETGLDLPGRPRVRRSGVCPHHGGRRPQRVLRRMGRQQEVSGGHGRIRIQRQAL